MPSLRRALTLVVLLGAAVPATDAQAATISLDAGRSDLVLGERTNVAGQLAGVGNRSGRRIVVEIDEYPFEGRWVTVERLRTDRRGRFAVVTEPTRNTQMRARLGSTVSPVITLFADFPGRVTRLGSGSADPRVRFTVFAFPGASIRRSPVFGYLSAGPGQPYRLAVQTRWSTKTRRYVAATVKFPAGTKLTGGAFTVCAPEAQPDAFGRPNEGDRLCGQPEIPRP